MNETRESLFPNEEMRRTHLESLTRFILDEWRQSTFR